MYGDDIYGVGTRCDPPSDHSSDEENEKRGALYMSVNKRKIRIAKEKKKAKKEQAAAEAKLAQEKAAEVSNQLV